MRTLVLVALLVVSSCAKTKDLRVGETSPSAATPRASAATPTPDTGGITFSTGSASPGPTAQASCSDLGAGPTFTLRLVNFAFQPSCLKVKAEQGFKLENKGTAMHNLTIQGTQVDLDVQPGQEGNFEAIGGVVRSGTYDLFCKYHKTRGMTGKITVTGTFSPGAEP